MDDIELDASFDGYEVKLNRAQIWRMARHNVTLSEIWDSVVLIKQSIKDEDFDTAREAWTELTESEQTGIYIAPSKGGVFTTREREVIKNGFNNA